MDFVRDIYSEILKLSSKCKNTQETNELSLDICNMNVLAHLYFLQSNTFDREFYYVNGESLRDFVTNIHRDNNVLKRPDIRYLNLEEIYSVLFKI